MRGFYARVWAWASCGAAFERPHATRGARRKGLFLAPALIAARPVKPCDRGVFRALNLLRKKERQARNPQAAQRGLAGRCLSAAVSGFDFAARLPKSRKPCGGPQCVFLATGLIAARPVKPCDGGVLGALNSLLKMKRNAPGLAQNRSAETAIQGAKTPRLFPKARGVQIKTKSRLYARFLRRRHAAAPPSRPPSAARPQPFMAGTAAGCGAGRQLHTGCVTSSTRSHMAKP